MTAQTLSGAAWEAMRAMGEFVASRGDAVGEKLEAWNTAKEAFDDKVRDIEGKVSNAKLAAIEIDEAVERFGAGDLDSVLLALLNAQKYFKGVA